MNKTNKTKITNRIVRGSVFVEPRQPILGNKGGFGRRFLEWGEGRHEKIKGEVNEDVDRKGGGVVRW